MQQQLITAPPPRPRLCNDIVLLLCAFMLQLLSITAPVVADQVDLFML